MNQPGLIRAAVAHGSGDESGVPLLRRGVSFLAALGGLVLAVGGTVVNDAALTVAGIVIGVSGSLLIYLPFRAPSSRHEAPSSTNDIAPPRAPCV
jgi:hypothetical protein